MTKVIVKITNDDSVIEIDHQKELALGLDASNTPVLFGCRTGICGTCLVEVNQSDKDLGIPDQDEKELLEIIAPDNKKARLACKLKANGNMELTYLGKK